MWPPTASLRIFCIDFIVCSLRQENKSEESTHSCLPFFFFFFVCVPIWRCLCPYTLYIHYVHQQRERGEEEELERVGSDERTTENEEKYRVVRSHFTLLQGETRQQEKI